MLPARTEGVQGWVNAIRVAFKDCDVNKSIAHCDFSATLNSTIFGCERFFRIRASLTASCTCPPLGFLGQQLVNNCTILQFDFRLLLLSCENIKNRTGFMNSTRVFMYNFANEPVGLRLLFRRGRSPYLRGGCAAPLSCLNLHEPQTDRLNSLDTNNKNKKIKTSKKN